MRILLAEDNPGNQFLALLILRWMGYQTDIVSDGLAAVEALKNVSYNLVIMDRKMPEMDGCEAAMRIRKPESGVLNPDVPIIAYTAVATDDEIRQCFAAGMNDYIGKPICMEEFKEKVSRWLEKSVTSASNALCFLEIK